MSGKNTGPRFGPGAPDDLVGTAAACEILCCTPSTLYRYVEAGSLPHWRRRGPDGGRGPIFVSRADCERMMVPGSPPSAAKANDAGREAAARAALRDAGLLPR